MESLLDERTISLSRIVEVNFEKWNYAIQTKSIEEVVKLYSENCTFLPTMSGDFKLGRKGVEEYFKLFLTKNPYSQIVEQEIQSIDFGFYIHSGLYLFKLGPSNKRYISEARFTFVWKHKGIDVWKIMHHHSSLQLK